MPDMVPVEVPAHWLVYFGVDDTDEAVATAVRSGATTLVPPADIPPGRFSVLADPDGAVRRHQDGLVSDPDGRPGNGLIVTDGGRPAIASGRMDHTPAPSRRGRRQPRGSRYGILLVAGVASLLLCSLIGVAGAEAGTPLAPPPVPKTGAYLGGFIGVSSKAGAALGTTETPAATTGYTDENLRELAEMSGLDAAIGHPLSIVHVYEDWGPAKRLVSNATLDALASTGAIPMINWNCGDSDADIVKGLDDHYITSYAKQLKAYGRPLFLRWYREPNLSLSSQWVHCAGGSVSTTPPCPSAATEGYVAAWQHIYDLFAAAGATNVAVVWNPGMGGQTGGYFLKCLYPGAKYVNWISIDRLQPSRARSAGQPLLQQALRELPGAGHLPDADQCLRLRGRHADPHRRDGCGRARTRHPSSPAPCPP